MTKLITGPVQFRRATSFFQERNGSAYQYFAGLIASISAFIGGVQTSWIACMLPFLISPSNPDALTNSEASTLAIIQNFTSMPGIIIGWLIADKFGRKTVLQLSSIPFVISGIIYATTLKKYPLYFAQFISGVGGSAVITALPIYLTEISSATNRGNLLSFFTFLNAFGGFLEYVITPITSYQLNGWIITALPLIMFALMFFIPESPYFLLMKNRKEETDEATWKLNLSEFELEQLVLGNENGRDHKYVDLFFIRSNRYALKIATVMIFCYCFSGRGAISTYSLVIFQENESFISSATSGIIFSAISILGLIFCVIFFESFNRKFVLVSSSLVILLSLFLVGIYYHLKSATDLSSNASNSIWSLCPLIALCVHKFASSGIDCLTFTIIAEIFPTKLKCLSGCLMTFIAGIFSAITVKVFQITYDQVGKSYAFWFFFLVYGLGTLFLIQILPETKGQGLEDIQVNLSKKSSKNCLNPTQNTPNT